MKKFILGSLSVLSLGLFSFIMPKTSTGVWLLSDGSYTIDADAVNNFSTDDQASVASLISTIYNIDATVEQDLSMIPDANGAAMAQKTIAAFILSSKFFKINHSTVAEGTPQYSLYQIINSYAQPVN